ncbi:MAG: ABC transporter substrate-binding protein [Bacillota bacterium]
MRKRKLFTAVLILAVVIALILSLAGCGQVAEEKNVLRVGMTREVESLNPMLVWSMQGYEVMMLNYNLLISWDEDLNPIANLARDWEADEDGMLWTFYLHEDVTWHDGEPFTAEDVKFTFEYIRDSEEELGYFYDYVAGMEEITVVDEHTVTIKTDEPLAWMPQIWVPILPKHIWEEIDQEFASSEFENEDPVGTGPFRVIEHVQGQYTRLAANDQYFKGRPELDEVILITYANADMMVEALKRGELDIITSVPAAQFKALVDDAVPDIVTLAASSPSFSELSFNVWEDAASLGNPLLLDHAVREAFEYAIDRDHLIEVAFYGYGEFGTTLVPPLYDFWHLKLNDDEIRHFNPDKAKEILDNAGYAVGDNGVRVSADGVPLSFELLVRTESPDNQKAAMLIKEWLNTVGIEITIGVIDEGTLTDRILESDFDMFIWGWYVDVDPTSILKIMTTDEIQSWSDCFYSNPEYDAMHLRQQRILDWDERQQMIFDMQRIVYDDIPYVLLSYDPELQAYRTDKYEGWTRNPALGPVIYTNTVETYERLQPNQ